MAETKAIWKDTTPYTGAVEFDKQRHWTYEKRNLKITILKSVVTFPGEWVLVFEFEGNVLINGDMIGIDSNAKPEIAKRKAIEIILRKLNAIMDCLPI